MSQTTVGGVKPDLGELISTLLKSKAGSTAKRYGKEILKFIDYCNFSRGVRSVPPFPVLFLFGLNNGINPLDSSIVP